MCGNSQCKARLAIARQLLISLLPLLLCCIGAFVCARFFRAQNITKEAQTNCINLVASTVGVLEGFLVSFVGIALTANPRVIARIIAYPAPKMELYSRWIVPGAIGVLVLLYAVILATFFNDLVSMPLLPVIWLLALFLAFIIGFLAAIISMIIVLHHSYNEHST